MRGKRVYGQIPVFNSTVSWLLVLCFALVIPANGQSRGGSTNKHARQFSLLQNPAASHYDVIALRVEFQADTTDFTTGDGTFGGVLYEDVAPPVLDALPHDEGYFGAHLQFLENYISRVSDGKTSVSTHLIPDVITVSGRMGAYAPTGLDAQSDVELEKLANLVEEAWTRASELDSFDLPPGLDPDHTAFVLFHAGVGRDVELTGTTLDKTPEDLPSLYFSGSTLDRLLGSFSVSVDGVPIRNTLLIPRTETRRGFDFIQDQNFLAEFSINGLLSASFLSYLGVPDLFNTETGESAIGPFGVMDGLGIFAYGGLIPPEPSAWTKMYLGWADLWWPEGGGEQQFDLSHGGALDANDVLIAPISTGEYFLVENRHRDPEGDGINLKVWQNGNVVDIQFDNASEGFNSTSRRDYPGGVVIDADNFDFALPGGRDDIGTDLIGGALVWHIDERILESGIESNSVNTNISRRGVDLEEADGGQDLGTPGLGIFGPSFEQGSPFDYFYAGNPTTVITPTGANVTLYENRFGPDTYPNSASNAGGESFIEVSAFSAPGSQMSVSYQVVPASGIQRIDDKSYTIDVAEGLVVVGSSILRVDSDAVDTATFLTGLNGRATLSWHKDGEFVDSYSGLLPAQPVVTNGRIVALGTGNFWELSAEGTLTAIAGLPSSLQILEVTTPVVAAIDDRFMVGVIDATGPFLLTADNGLIQIDRFSQPLISLALIDGLRPVLVFPDRVEISELGLSWTIDAVSETESLSAMFAQGDEGISGVLADVDRDRVILLKPQGEVEYIDLQNYTELGVSGAQNRAPLILDLDGDSRADVLTSVGRSLVAFNQEGAVVNRFPIQMRAPTTVRPLVARFSGDGPPVILIATEDGQIDAYDTGASNHRVPGFPLSGGSGFNVVPGFAESSLTGLSSDGAVVQWEFDSVDRVYWGQEHGAGNRSFVQLPEIPRFSEALSGRSTSDEVGESYNWPNPIREGVTWIRFTPASVSDVKITIVDLAGKVVDRLDLNNAPAGVSSELEWRPTVGSGVYLARLQLTDGSGSTTYQLIKMAVIR